MRRWLVLLLAALIAASPAAWPEPAAAKTSDDFSDLQDLDAATKAKFDAMIAAGVFDGVGDGKFGLKDEMNRAQFAKVAALLFKLEVDSSLKASSFADVGADGSNGWALPYIEAVKKAGITDGVGNGAYDPAGTVTKEQLAAFLIKGLGLREDAMNTPGVEDETVSDWAKGYVALALQKKLVTNERDGVFGGTAPVIREQLVLTSYEAKVVVEQIAEQKKLEEEKKQQEEQKKQEEQKAQQQTSNPTPTHTPSPSPSITVSTPTADPKGGTVTANTYVALSTATDGASIYYTTDGSTPTSGSTLYAEPIWVTNTVTIRAIGVKDGSADSAIMTETYTAAASTDATAPAFSATYPKAGHPQPANSKQVGILIEVNEDATAYYVVVPDGASAPSAAQIIAGQGSTGEPAPAASSRLVSADFEEVIVTGALPSDNTPYDVYVVVRDAAGNASAPAKVDVTTPVGTLAVLRAEDTGSGIVRVTFNMNVDSVTAGDPQNYRFSVPDNSSVISEYAHSATVDGNIVDLDASIWYQYNFGVLTSEMTIELTVTDVEIAGVSGSAISPGNGIAHFHIEE